MIGIDLCVLSLLKTFALIRSQIRYYTTKSGLTNNNKNTSSRKKGRKEWRMKLGKATNWNQFREVEIEEPIPTATIVTPTEATSTLTPKFVTILQSKFRRLFHTITSPEKPNNMKRAKSCVQLDHDTLHTSSSIHRTGSSISLATGAQFYTDDEQFTKDLEKELGSKGGMLLQTTARLREARLQASRGSRMRLRKAQLISSGSFGGGGGVVEPISEDDNLGHGYAASLNDINNNEEEDSEDTVEEAFTGNTKVDDPVSAMTFLLTGIVKRNHLSVEDILIEDAQSVMECGRHRLSAKARNVIMGYHEEVANCLDWIAEFGSCTSSTSSTSSVEYGNSSPFKQSSSSRGMGSGSVHRSRSDLRMSSPSMNGSYPDNPHAEILERINLVRKMKHNMGRSALMLSGGGAQAMYHLGTVKALCESDLYKDIPVISGTSGGSIVAAMCAIKTSDELLRDACVPHIATDYNLTGEMKRLNIRWFPKLVEMGAYWLNHRLLVDSKEFKRCCDFYYGDITFEEAFKRTGKHVCITVSASRVEDNGGGSGGRGAQRLLLNSISTPHVTISSAVAASCALPGVMAPAKLVTKNSVGTKESFEVDGVEWIDGSVQADLPFKRISTLFNVSNYIVCQTNFHVLPFLRKPHHPNPKSFYWRVFQTCEWDMRNRALNLSRFGLFPKIFGQDISKVFKQKYHGNLTLVPRFTTMQVFGLNALANPTVEDMEIYLQNGQAAAWPYLSVIKEMLRLETSIDRCISRLSERMRQISPDSDFQNLNNDLVSDASANHAYMFSAHRETELLKEKVESLESENTNLRKQLEQMSRAVGISMISNALSKSPSQIGFVSYNYTELGKEDKKEG